MRAYRGVIEVEDEEAGEEDQEHESKNEEDGLMGETIDCILLLFSSATEHIANL